MTNFDPKRQFLLVNSDTGEETVHDMDAATLKKVNFGDVEKVVRDILGDVGISQCYTDGVFDHFTVSLSTFQPVSLQILETLSQRLGTKQISIEVEDGTDWGDDKDSDEVVITVRDWKAIP